MNRQETSKVSTQAEKPGRFAGRRWVKTTLAAVLAMTLACFGSAPSNAAPSSKHHAAPAVDPTSAPAQPVAPSDAYIIGADDILSINVWNEPNLTRLVTVRSDGKISLPLVGELQAAGRTPAELDQDITVVLKSYITDPQVAVIVQEIKSQNFNILGEVNRPGAYPLTAGTTIVDAIAQAGGFKDFAKKKGIYVLRPDANGQQTRIGFNYQQFLKGKNVAQNIRIKPHDTIFVP